MDRQPTAATRRTTAEAAWVAAGLMRQKLGYTSTPVKAGPDAANPIVGMGWLARSSMS